MTEESTDRRHYFGFRSNIEPSLGCSVVVEEPGGSRDRPLLHHSYGRRSARLEAEHRACLRPYLQQIWSLLSQHATEVQWLCRGRDRCMWACPVTICEFPGRLQAYAAPKPHTDLTWPEVRFCSRVFSHRGKLVAAVLTALCFDRQLVLTLVHQLVHKPTALMTCSTTTSTADP